MAYSVRALHPSEVPDALVAIESLFQVGMKCSVQGPLVPTQRDFTINFKKPDSFALGIYLDAEPDMAGVALSERGMVRWLIATDDEYLEIARALARTLRPMYGEAYGFIENETIRGILLADNEFVESPVDPRRIDWIG